MDVIQKGIITLIKSAVIQKPLPLPEGFSLEKAYPLIVRQHIVALAFEGAVLCGIPRQDSVMGKLFQGYCKSLQVSEGQLHEVERLTQAFRENGIDYLPLKGCVMKKLYPKPELRTMGDADILIRMEQYDRILQLVKQLGFAWGHEDSCHTVMVSDKLNLELHRNMLSEKHRAFVDYFGNGWHLAVPLEENQYTMSPEDTFLFLLVHFTKHYMWSGIGCRHVVDLWVYLRSQPQLNEALLREKLEELKLWEFYCNIRVLLEYWFEDGVSNDMLEYMTRFLFSGGSWGTIESNMLAEAIHNAGADNLGKKASVFMFYLKKLFPSAEDLRWRYPVLKKMPWLLPAVWLVRIFDKLFVKKVFVKSYKTAVSAVKQENIDQRQMEMQYVGLSECMKREMLQ